MNPWIPTIQHFQGLAPQASLLAPSNAWRWWLQYFIAHWGESWGTQRPKAFFIYFLMLFFLDAWNIVVNSFLEVLHFKTHEQISCFDAECLYQRHSHNQILSRPPWTNWPWKSFSQQESTEQSARNTIHEAHIHTILSSRCSYIPIPWHSHVLPMIFPSDPKSDRIKRFPLMITLW